MHRLIEDNASPAATTANAMRPDIWSRPRSATALSTGFAGLWGAALAFVALTRTGLPVHLKALGIVGCTAAAMIAVEFLFRTRDVQTAGLARTVLRPLNLERVTRKLTGLAVTIGVIAAAYWLLAEYQRDFYAPFFAAVGACAPAFLIAAPLYVAWIDRRQHDPEDVYAEIGAFMLSGRVPRNLGAIGQHALGWAVKAFFLPLMFVYLCSTIGSAEKTLAAGDIAGLVAWHSFAVDALFGIDVLFACVGYLLTLRLLGTHIRSVEPTVLGWVACLICYAPFNQITSAYITYDAAGWRWDVVLEGWPLLRFLWGAAILFLVVVYVWSTVVFGLRFSNLTKRGIITVGPYRWVKHPAYLSKNISWWLISMPFLLGAGVEDAVRHSAMLLLFNGVYVLRALTEERHLSRDPDYRAYQAFMARHGLWARARTLLLAPRQNAPTG